MVAKLVNLVKDCGLHHRRVPHLNQYEVETNRCKNTLTQHFVGSQSFFYRIGLLPKTPGFGDQYVNPLKGGDPAAPSSTATLLRLHPSH